MNISEEYIEIVEVIPIYPTDTRRLHGLGYANATQGVPTPVAMGVPVTVLPVPAVHRLLQAAGEYMVDVVTKNTLPLLNFPEYGWNIEGLYKDLTDKLDAAVESGEYQTVLIQQAVTIQEQENIVRVSQGLNATTTPPSLATVVVVQVTAPDVTEVEIDYPPEYFPTAAPTPTPPLIPLIVYIYAAFAVGGLILMALLRLLYKYEAKKQQRVYIESLEDIEEAMGKHLGADAIVKKGKSYSTTRKESYVMSMYAQKVSNENPAKSQKKPDPVVKPNDDDSVANSGWKSSNSNAMESKLSGEDLDSISTLSARLNTFDPMRSSKGKVVKGKKGKKGKGEPAEEIEDAFSLSPGKSSKMSETKGGDDDDDDDDVSLWSIDDAFTLALGALRNEDGTTALKAANARVSIKRYVPPSNLRPWEATPTKAPDARSFQSQASVSDLSSVRPSPPKGPPVLKPSPPMVTVVQQKLKGQSADEIVQSLSSFFPSARFAPSAPSQFTAADRSNYSGKQLPPLNQPSAPTLSRHRMLSSSGSFNMNNSVSTTPSPGAHRNPEAGKRAHKKTRGSPSPDKVEPMLFVKRPAYIALPSTPLTTMTRDVSPSLTHRSMILQDIDESGDSVKVSVQPLSTPTTTGFTSPTTTGFTSPKTLRSPPSRGPPVPPRSTPVSPSSSYSPSSPYSLQRLSAGAPSSRSVVSPTPMHSQGLRPAPPPSAYRPTSGERPGSGTASAGPGSGSGGVGRRPGAGMLGTGGSSSLASHGLGGSFGMDEDIDFEQFKLMRFSRK